jgi:DNA-binding beta-propeller fold protein YncE
LPALRPVLAACLAALALPSIASAARTVYFADPAADEIAQFAVGPARTLTSLDPPAVAARKPLRLAMTPDGTRLYATAEDGVLGYDVAPDGRLSARQPALTPSGDDPHSIAIHPDGKSAYVTDGERGKVRQFDIVPGGGLVAKDPPFAFAGWSPRGVAVSPDGKTAYVLVTGGIALYDVAADGSLTRRDGRVAVPSWALEDLALTPDGEHLYVTSRDGRVFQFSVAPDGAPVAASPPALVTGGRPVGIAVAPDGTAAYMSVGGTWGHGSRRVLGFAVGPDGRLAPAADVELADPAPKRLGYLTVSPDGRSLFVAGRDGHLFDLGAGGTLAPKLAPSVDLHAAVGVVVSPNQAPLASFAATPGDAGSPTRFDASGAGDPDGTIVRYDWDFGDGTQLLDGGPNPTHVYTQPGIYTVTLVVTDNEGASTTMIFTGGTVLGNGAPGAQTSRQIEVAAPAGQPAAPQESQGLRPDLGETLVAEPVAGIVRVRLPGTRRFVPLDAVRELPLGSTLDTRRGRVDVATERRRGGQVQHGVFRDGLFAVRQRRGRNPFTDLVLRGRVGRCPAGEASAARRARRLWGSARGRFRTRGRLSSGAVRGTRWLTVDRCDGTLTVVREGIVAVRDFGLDRTVLVEAGERYLARRR